MAVGGRIKVRLTIDSVLSRVTPLQIYERYMPHRNWQLNQPCISPFPKSDGSMERNPSFIIGNRNGDVYHLLFSDSEKRGNCFNFVKQLHNLTSLDEVLRMIDKDFNLGILKNNPISVKYNVPQTYSESEEKGMNKRNTLIQVIPRPFTSEELKYWNQFHLDESELKDIYSIKKLYFNKKLYTFKDSELKFGYFYPEFSTWKIYRPLSDKKQKWAPNNTSIHALDYKENIKNCDVALIAKSRKDTLVLRKFYKCTIGVQNESIGCFTPDNIKYIKDNSNSQILAFDSDTPGKENSIKITQKFNFGYINTPNYLLQKNIKDFADWGRYEGLSKIEEFLKQKNLI